MNDERVRKLAAYVKKRCKISGLPEFEGFLKVCPVKMNEGGHLVRLRAYDQTKTTRI